MSRNLSSTKKALDAVQQVCAQRGLRFTAVRREVLEMLLQAGTSCKAYDLLARLAAASNTQPTAVYRALDFLLEHGFAHKIHSQNAYIACGHPHEQHAQHEHDCHFFICRQCGGAWEHCSPATSEAISKAARKNKFRKARAVVEVFGDCDKCASR